MIDSIALMRMLSALLFLITSIIIFRIYIKTKHTTNFWLFVFVMAFLSFLESSLNVFEHLNMSSILMDATGEYLTILIDLIAIIIAFLFLRTKGGTE